MNAFSPEWLAAEARHQGLDLTEADVQAIYERVKRVKDALAALRLDVTEGVEPPYQFVIERGDAGSGGVIP